MTVPNIPPVEERDGQRIDDSWTSGFAKDRAMQYLWGARYIDDIIMHREDANGDGDFTDFGQDPPDRRWWHLTDVQFSTIVSLDDAANTEERVRYDAYGRALHHEWRDVDGDRDYDSSDRTTISNIAAGANNSIGQSNYKVEADLNRDGVIDLTDVTLATTNYVSALPAGDLSNSTVKNTIGWDGYVFNPEDQSYKVRFRWYSTELGRWLERDPVLFADGPHHYQLSLSRPLTNLDPNGLCAEDPIASWGHLISKNAFNDWIKKHLGPDFNAYGKNPWGINVNDAEWGWVLREADEAELGNKGWDRAWQDWLSRRTCQSTTKKDIKDFLDELMEDKKFKRILQRGFNAPCSYDSRQNMEEFKRLFREYGKFLEEQGGKTLTKIPSSARGLFSRIVRAAPHVVLVGSFAGIGLNAFGMTSSLTEGDCRNYFRRLYQNPCDPMLSDSTAGGLAWGCALQLAESGGGLVAGGAQKTVDALVDFARRACDAYKHVKDCCELTPQEGLEDGTE